jgi:hypothetical protein
LIESSVDHRSVSLYYPVPNAPKDLGRKEATMANDHWYVLTVRSGFAPVVAHNLHRLNLETIVPDSEPFTSRKTYVRKSTSFDYVYCRFANKARVDVTSIPGVVDVIAVPPRTVVDSHHLTR